MKSTFGQEKIADAVNNLAEALKMCARAYLVVGTVDRTYPNIDTTVRTVDQLLERENKDASV